MHSIPLAERCRPSSLDELIGQEHLTGKNGVLRRMFAYDKLPSLIFWGAPGTGKTTLANIISLQIKAQFYTISAVSSGVKEVREIINKAKTQANSILFIDEIHRFNKSQQDALLQAVEKGTITLIGATTENPSFEVNPALLSRCQVYTLKPLHEKDLLQLLHNAIKKDVFLKEKRIEIKEHEALIRLSGGDARKLLNIFEMYVSSVGDKKVVVTNKEITKVALQKIALYDKKGEQHYDIISAFIKSIRGSDPNATVYWLARMIDGGEDVKFIARRMIISASEDVGNANPTALVIATNCFNAVNMIGYPEARIILSQCAIYLACSPKSNASYAAINNALELVKKTGNLPVPLHLRNAPTNLMRNMGYGKEYKYNHSFKNNFTEQEYLPIQIANSLLYTPNDNVRENEIRKRLKALWKDKYGY